MSVNKIQSQATRKSRFLLLFIFISLLINNNWVSTVTAAPILEEFPPSDPWEVFEKISTSNIPYESSLKEYWSKEIDDKSLYKQLNWGWIVTDIPYLWQNLERKNDLPIGVLETTFPPTLSDINISQNSRSYRRILCKQVVELMVNLSSFEDEFSYSKLIKILKETKFQSNDSNLFANTQTTVTEIAKWVIEEEKLGETRSNEFSDVKKDLYSQVESIVFDTILANDELKGDLQKLLLQQYHINIKERGLANKIEYHPNYVAEIISSKDNLVGFTGVFPSAQIIHSAILTYSKIDIVSEIQYMKEEAPNLRVINMSFGKIFKTYENLIREYHNQQSHFLDFSNINFNLYSYTRDHEDELLPKMLDNYKKGSDFEKFLKSFSSYVVENDLLLVIAAGNDHVDTKWSIPFLQFLEPEVLDNIIIVGAVDNSRPKEINEGNCKLKFKLAEFSHSLLKRPVTGTNYGDFVDVFAPGKHMPVIDAKGNLNSGQGTSFSAPMVTGIAAAIFEINPEFTAKEVKDIIIQGAEASGHCVKDPKSEKGFHYIVNAKKSIELAKEYKPQAQVEYSEEPAEEDKTQAQVDYSQELAQIIQQSEFTKDWIEIRSFEMPDIYNDKNKYHPMIPALFRQFSKAANQYGVDGIMLFDDFDELLSHTYVLEEIIDFSPEEMMALNHLRSYIYCAAFAHEPWRRNGLPPGIDYSSKPDLIDEWLQVHEKYEQMKAQSPIKYEYYRKLMLATGYAPQAYIIDILPSVFSNVSENQVGMIVGSGYSYLYRGGGMIGQVNYDQNTDSLIDVYGNLPMEGVDWLRIYGVDPFNHPGLIASDPANYPFDKEELAESIQQGGINYYSFEESLARVESMIQYIESIYDTYFVKDKIAGNLNKYMPGDISSAQSHYVHDMMYEYYLILREQAGISDKKDAIFETDVQIPEDLLQGQHLFVNESVSRHQYIWLDFDQLLADTKNTDKTNPQFYEYLEIVQEAEPVRINVQRATGENDQVSVQTRLSIWGQTWHQWSTDQAYLILNEESNTLSLLLPAEDSNGEIEAFWIEYPAPELQYLMNP